MSDLFISVRNGQICLRSKKLNKDIIPRLTNAHNYRNTSMPVYLFLCDMQMQYGRDNLYFNWGFLYNELTFFPRVRYRNTILSLAAWRIEIAEIKYLFSIKENEELLFETSKWRNKYKLPTKMLLPDGDNELLIDWDNVKSIKALFPIIKGRKSIMLTEYLYNPKYSIVKDEFGNSYPNQCVVSFYKKLEK